MIQPFDVSSDRKVLTKFDQIYSYLFEYYLVKTTHTYYDHVFSNSKAKGINMSSYRIDNVVRAHLVISSGVDLLRRPLKCRTITSCGVKPGRGDCTMGGEAAPASAVSRLDNGAALVVFLIRVALL